MHTSEVLDTAADLIEERGWLQGPGGWDGYVADNQRLCLEGGIMAALGITDERPGSLYGSGEVCPAYAAVASYLDKPERPGLSAEIPNDSWLWHWNDSEGRTAAEVIEVLRAAAVIEAAKEADERHARKVAAVRALHGPAAADRLAGAR